MGRNSVEREILSLKETALFCGLGRSTVLRYEHAGHFPRRRRLGPARIGWLRIELEAWIESREPVLRGGGSGFGASGESPTRSQSPASGGLGRVAPHTLAIEEPVGEDSGGQEGAPRLPRPPGS